MEIKELQERIEKNQIKIAKIEKRITKLENQKSVEWFDKDHEWFHITAASRPDLYQQHLDNTDREIKHSYREIASCEETIKKYQQAIIAETDKLNTLDSLPETVKTFREELINTWNAYDRQYRDNCKFKYNEAWSYYEAGDRETYKKLYRELPTGWREMLHKSDSEIEAENIKAANSVILNMIDRVISLTGKITDTKYIHLDRDNNGYAIINGIIIGEKGQARIESIGAGGYNIQRYHIRVLVK